MLTDPNTSSPPQPPQTLADTLVGRGDTAAGFASALEQAVSLAAQTIYDAEHPVPPSRGTTASDLLDHVDLSSPLGRLDDALAELRGLWLDSAVFYHHPRYLSHLNCPVATPAVAAEVLATALNTAVESWDQAGAAAHIEQRLIRWISGALGMPATANGVFTSGGTQSNLQALTIARNKARRFADLDTLVIITSPAAHYSVRRAADILGIPPENFLCVDGSPHDSDVLDPASLGKAIEQTRGAGLHPAAVVATAGTTDRGLIDPLTEIAGICRSEEIHLHVDAAYGGAACLSPTRSGVLRGIGQADSVTVDFHKTFYQPVACSAVLLRDDQSLAHVRTHAEYLNPADAPQLNLADYSLQTTRRFDALKLWVTLRTVGPEAIGAAFDRTVQLAREVAVAIDTDERFACLELFETPRLSTVLFSLRDDPQGALTEQVRDSLYDSGTAAIAITRLRGRRLMKLTILDPTLSLNDIFEVLDAIVRAGRAACSSPSPAPAAGQF